MTCTHQWHDATSSAGPEWVCAKCEVTYSETKKAPPAQRTWVGLTNEEKGLELLFDTQGRVLDYEDYADAIEAKLMGKNT